MLAHYHYTLRDRTIPLLIIKHDDDPTQHMEDISYDNGVIILTRDDLKHGLDVFALQLVHMQQYTQYISGKRDYLAKLTIRKKHVRHHIETLARQMLIDSREHRLVGTSRDTIRDQSLLALERMASGYHFLDDKLDYDEVDSLIALHSKLLDIVQHIDKK
jgi:hypothetical protein